MQASVPPNTVPRAWRWSRKRVALAMYFAWQSLYATRQRAILALLGITIGVAAIVALMSIGKSVEKKALQEFDRMGTQVISVAFMETGNPSTRSERVADILRYFASQKEVAQWSEVLNLNCESNNQRRAQQSLQLVAVRPQLGTILGLKLQQGRFLHPLDGDQRWVVLGARVAEQLQGMGYNTTAGTSINICAQSMVVAGTLAPSAQADGTLIPFEVDNALIISLQAAQRLERGGRLDNMVALLHKQVAPIDYAESLKSGLEQLSGKSVAVTTAQKIIELRKEQIATYGRFLTALGSISLLVGALGILNIMLIAVVERRKEIGIRLALGANDSDIALQFLSESMLLGVAGGALGIVLGLLASGIACALIHLPFQIALVSLPLALVLATVVGACAGLYPAWQAARLDPIETLQGT